MAVYKRDRSKFYWTKFTFEGKLIQQSTKCTSKQKALEFEASLRHQLNFRRIDLTIEKPKQITFSDACREFLASLAGQVKDSTICAYETKSKAPMRYLGGRTVDSFSRKDIDAYITNRQKDKKIAPFRKLKKNAKVKSKKVIAGATINRELALIRMVCNYVKPGLWQSIAKPDRSRKLKFLKENEEAWRVIELWEERKYLIACSQPLRDVASLMLETGMRPEEVLSLEANHVNFDLGYLQISRGKTRSARRKLALTERAKVILESRIAQACNGRLFPGGKNGKGEEPYIKLTKAHNAAVERAGLKKFRLYDCRHTFATRAVQVGVDLVTLKDILGHATLSMVTRYAHPTEQHRFDAMTKIEAFRKTG